jgi:UDP-N-acetylglucosamine--N-acetylmuramyl-(pentapeptide) pyrophosphoryl-undecaprenol N-acetylglucosamine transferase
MKILFAGGGTAGHMFPIIATIREIKKKYSKGEFEFFYVGPKDKLFEELLSKEGVKVKTIWAGKIRRYFSFQNIIDILFKLPISFFQSFYYVFTISPDLIFGKGGYGSISTIVAGYTLLTPIFIHESDTCPGLANKIASKFALEIFTSFSVRDTEYFPIEKVIAIGNPERAEIFEGSLEKAKKIFNLKGGKPVIFILGGSQGSQKINDVVLIVLSDFLENFEIIHQVGKENFKQIKAEAEVVINKNLKEYYHPFAFLNEQELPNAYKVADLVISRAGAGAIFEIAALGKPSILVPLPKSAQNHQIKNAYTFAKNGSAIVVEQKNFTPYFILEKVKYLISQPKKLEEMSKKAKEFSKPEAANMLAEYITSYLTWK